MSCAVHISLNVSNLPRSVDFYRRLFGEPAKLKADYAKFVAAEPEVHLALQPGPVSGPGTLSHLGIRVDSPDRVHEWRNLLKGRGLPTEEEKREVCCDALQEKFWVSDPDGNRWEVYAVLEDIEQRAGPAMSCCQPKDPASNLEGKAAAACC